MTTYESAIHHKPIWMWAESVISAAAEADPLAHATILVADTDPDIRRLMNVAFRDAARVVEAGDGCQALMLGLQLRPTAYVIAAELPRIDGLDLCRQLRAANVDEPIVLVTGWECDEDAPELLYGADACRSKPFSVRDLVTCVGTLISQRVPARAASSRCN